MRGFLSCFTENNLISDNQLGFKLGNSYINQLLSITHEIYQSVDDFVKKEVYFLIHLKYLIRYGTKVVYTI